jgi:dGTPase
MDMTNYKELINGKRYRVSTSVKNNISAESQSDRARLIFSAPFRRLQRKAQVFPLESATAVRTRLTHSLEVASVGKYIAQTIVNRINEEGLNDAFGLTEHRDIAFVNMVETACLMHDIGNPPFGHFGEYAICDWFLKNGIVTADKSLSSELGEKHILVDKLKAYEKNEFQDFVKFDGNAQGFRIVTKLQGNDGKTGLNLTYSQLGAYLKYVCPPHKVDSDKKALFINKPGYFFTETEIIKALWKNLNMTENTRHPLAYIMEAADDIAYCLSDIEDGVEKRIIDEDYLQEKILNEIKSYCDGNSVDSTCHNDCKRFVEDSLGSEDEMPIPPFMKFKTSLINFLVKTVTDIYIDNHDEVLSGKIGSLIKQNDKCYTMLKSLKRFAINSIFRSREAEDIELGGYSVIYGLLEHLSRLLKCPRKDFIAISNSETKAPNIGNTDLERRLYNLLPAIHIKAYSIICDNCDDDLLEWHYRAHLIIDYISGMTDDYALKTYQLLSGIKVN